MDNTLDTLPVENMTIKNIFQQIINEAETNKQSDWNSGENVKKMQ